jgi:DNA-directed RNA polymerase specialized sigma24 family protein
MIAIVRNLAIGHLRRADIGLISQGDSLTHPEWLAIQQPAQYCVCLRGEPEPHGRLVLATAYLHEETRKQLSQRFGLSVEAVKALLRKALLELDRAPE